MRLREGWAPAPEFDEDHPEELSYRPFPMAPLLTQSASADDEALVKIVHPNLERTLDLLDDKQIVLPMRLRPGRSDLRGAMGPAVPGQRRRFPRARDRSGTRGGQRPHLAPGQDDGALSGRVCFGFLRPGGTQPFDQATLMRRPSSRKSLARGDVARQARPTVR